MQHIFKLNPYNTKALNNKIFVNVRSVTLSTELPVTILQFRAHVRWFCFIPAHIFYDNDLRHFWQGKGHQVSDVMAPVCRRNLYALIQSVVSWVSWRPIICIIRWAPKWSIMPKVIMTPDFTVHIDFKYNIGSLNGKLLAYL